jgi:hypothetical protein
MMFIFSFFRSAFLGIAIRKFLDGLFGEQAFSGDPEDGLSSIFGLCIRVAQRGWS